MLLQDEIEIALVDRFKQGITAQTFSWDWVERYAIDTAARKELAAIGIVDQGQKFMPKTSNSTQRWRVAIEFFVRCNTNEDPKSKVNLARAIIFQTMMEDKQLDDMLLDTNAVADDVFVNRAERYGEGVMVFDIDYRTKHDDIATAL